MLGFGLIRGSKFGLVAKTGATIECIAKAYLRKEVMVAKVLLAARGDAPGLVHVISAMEACAT